MANLYEMRAASFRGVRFLVPHGEIGEGRHAVMHNYPDAAFRYVEDNGLIPPDFKVHAVVHGANSLAWLNQLRGALNRPGPGTLIHPLYGRQTVQVVGPYKVRHTDKTTGVITLDIHFAVTGPAAFPAVLSGIAAVIPGMAATALAQLVSAFAGGWSFASGLTAATHDAVAGALGLVASATDSYFSASAAASRAMATLAHTPALAIADGAVLGACLETIVTAPFEDGAIETRHLWPACQRLAETGAALAATAAAIGPSTVDLAARQVAIDRLATAVQAAAFVGLCRAAVETEHATAQDVIEAITVLEGESAALAERQMAREARDAVDALLSETVAVLMDEQITLPEVVRLAVHEIPASVLAYRLTDSTDDLPLLVGLNEGRNPVLYDGAVAVLRHPV